MDVGAPAVVAAIHDATGAWVHDLPATPERILAALGATPPIEAPAGLPGRRRGAAVEAPIEEGTDPRPDARTDPLPLRGPGRTTAASTTVAHRMTAFRSPSTATRSRSRSPGMRRLLDVLREDLGAHRHEGGLRGRGVRRLHGPARRRRRRLAASSPICQVDGADVRTVEGLAAPSPEGPALDRLQQAFLEAGGAQCGICTPGMLMAARSYLDAGGGADEDAIREAIAGNLCRCTGYTKIVEAIAIAAGSGGNR